MLTSRAGFALIDGSGEVITKQKFTFISLFKGNILLLVDFLNVGSLAEFKVSINSM